MSESLSESSASKSSASKSSTDTSSLEVALSEAIALAKESDTLSQANEKFETLLAQVSVESPAIAPLLQQLWREFTSVQRSAAFWQVMSDAEKELSDKMSATHIQLKQNYMRLIQEQ